MNAPIERFYLTGELTIYTAKATQKVVDTALACKKNIVLDLSDVTEIDTAGLQLLIMAKKEAVRESYDLQLVGHSDAIIEAFELVGVSRFFGDPVVIPKKNVRE